MPLNKITPASIADIEQQIAKATTELEKARAQEFITTEKAFLAAQKATAAAQLKVDTLEAKASTTPAALARLKTAQAALTAEQAKLASADELYSALVAAQEAADQFATNVAKVMAGEKLGKKIKFTKKEKAVIKEDKKAAKKIAKAEKKFAKEKAKKDAKAATKLAKEDVAIEAPETINADIAAKPARKASVRKAPDRQTPVKKTPTKKVAVSETAESPIVQAVIAELSTPLVELNQEVPTPVESAIEASIAGTSVVESIATAETTLAKSDIETPNTEI